MNLDLDDRSVLVTGGSRGIGRAIVYAYAAERARVTLTYNSNSEAATATVKRVDEGACALTDRPAKLKSKRASTTTRFLPCINPPRFFWSTKLAI